MNLSCISGDHRVNEQITLTVLQTIWSREHNKIAAELKKINPHWDDETLYQVSRTPVNWKACFKKAYCCFKQNANQVVQILHTTSVTKWIHFFNLWPFTSLIICIKFAKNLPKFAKYQNKTIPKISKRLIILPKWQNFATSGHTATTYMTLPIRTSINVARVKPHVR